MMTLNWPILSVITFLPILGALLIMLLVRGNGGLAKGTARWIALWTTLVTFAVSVVLVLRFDASTRRNSSSSRSSTGWASPPITWASTAFRCRS